MASLPQLVNLDDGLLVRAPAKLNLSLLIAGKRPDGFHEIETVMAKVDWCDEVRIQSAPRPGIEFSCQGPCWAPNDQTNLVYRTARLVLDTCGRDPGIRLTLTKNIPAGSGLGSGSSDAAATLLGLNTYLQLGWSRSHLMDLAGRLGSDVAFFLNGPLALCTGRGEKITELDARFPFVALLILPDVNASTKEVYAHYTHDPALYRRLHAQIHTQIEKNRIDLVTGLCANMLESSCFHLYEELGALKEAIESLGVGPVCLSGSGSTMFSMADSLRAESLEELRSQIRERTGCKSVVVKNNGW
jgi:4-diphosphocytidyl-2-C-methyl-D-erythritol kinase